MKTVTVQVAKTHLSELVAEVAGGSEVIIVRGAVPVARLVAAEPVKRRRFGALKGGAGFDETFFDRSKW